ncbi:MAG: NAD-dependent epimerase/dehydratase family protein [Verrucomicrobiales bacterium]
MILVTGGLGVMGTTLVKGLIEKGNKVRVLDIPNHPHKNRLDGTGAEIVFGDVTKSEGLAELMEGVDTVYHLAAVLIAHDPAVFDRVNVQGTKNLIEASTAAGVKHFIFVSSASVVYPHTTAYSISKQKCERMLKEQTAMKWTIVRPTLAYNEHGGQEFRMFMDSLTRFPVFAPFIGSGQALKRPVHVDDLMAGFLAIPNNEKAYGKTYAFSGGEPISMWDLAKLMLKHTKQKRIMIPIPIPICKLIASVLGKVTKNPPLTWNGIAGVMQDANLDNSEAQNDLGYKPIGIHEGMKRSYPIG